MCRGMMLEISALQAKVAQLEQEKNSQEKQLSLKFKERYDPLVQHLFSTCVQLKVRNFKLEYIMLNNGYKDCISKLLYTNLSFNLEDFTLLMRIPKYLNLSVFIFTS